MKHTKVEYGLKIKPDNNPDLIRVVTLPSSNNEQELNALKTKRNIWKIYVAVNIKEKEIVYVGIASRSISSRMRSGINPNGKKSYPYKWKNIINAIQLFVYFFPEVIKEVFDENDTIEIKKNKEAQNKINQDKIERIEAELAFLVRTKTGKWPAFQNEIHFNNEFIEGATIAQEIYEDLQQHLK